nr:MAG TPA: hypothetical protein [Caudoviricetes sp.]DAW65216.1 MAG TPA: hypothetical protein [Caudoviricetes sp.]
MSPDFSTLLRRSPNLIEPRRRNKRRGFSFARTK